MSSFVGLAVVSFTVPAIVGGTADAAVQVTISDKCNTGVGGIPAFTETLVYGVMRTPPPLRILSFTPVPGSTYGGDHILASLSNCPLVGANDVFVFVGDRAGHVRTVFYDNRSTVVSFVTPAGCNTMGSQTLSCTARVVIGVSDPATMTLSTVTAPTLFVYSPPALAIQSANPVGGIAKSGTAVSVTLYLLNAPAGIVAAGSFKRLNGSYVATQAGFWAAGAWLLDGTFHFNGTASIGSETGTVSAVATVTSGVVHMTTAFSSALAANPTATLSVVTDGQTAARSSFIVYPVDVPTVTYASPVSTVSAAGGTAITMRIINIATAPTSIVICGTTVALISAAVSTGTNAFQLLFAAVACAIGFVPVQLTLSGATIWNFTATQPTAIATPAASLSSGGRAVSVRAYGIVATRAVTISFVGSTGASVAASDISVAVAGQAGWFDVPVAGVPPAAAGDYTATITQGNVTASFRFSYIDPPGAPLATPNATVIGTTAGVGCSGPSTAVGVTFSGAKKGMMFSASLEDGTVVFVSSAAINKNGAATLSLMVPPVCTAGSRHVQIAFAAPYDWIAPLRVAFRYQVPLPSVVTVTPSRVNADGGDTVTVKVASLLHVQSASQIDVEYGTRSATVANLSIDFSDLDATQIKFIAPAADAAGPVAVTVRTALQSASFVIYAVYVTIAASVTGIAYAPGGGAIAVSITGFAATVSLSSLSCTVGGTAVTISLVVRTAGVVTLALTPGPAPVPFAGATISVPASVFSVASTSNVAFFNVVYAHAVVVTSCVFWNDYSGIRCAFNQPSAGAGVVGCGTLFDAASTAALGALAECEFKSASALTVTLGASFTLAPGASLTVVRGAVASAVNASDVALANAQTTLLVGPDTSATPVSAQLLLSPATGAGVCDTIMLDASTSVGAAPFVFSYSVSGSVNAALSMWLSAQGGTGVSSIAVPPDRLPPQSDVDYNFTVSIVDAVGRTDAVSATIHRSSLSPPILSPASGSTSVTANADGLVELQVVASFSRCAVVESLTTTWRDATGASAPTATLTSAGTHAVMTGMRHGNVYTLMVTTTPASDPSLMATLTFSVAVPLPPIAVGIAFGSNSTTATGTYQLGATLTFEATVVDPATATGTAAGITLSWLCMDSAGGLCRDSHTHVIINFGTANTATFAGNLGVGSYSLSLHVAAGTRAADASATLTVVGAAVPNLSLGFDPVVSEVQARAGVGYDAVMNANSKLVLTAASDSSDAAAGVYVWSVSPARPQLALGSSATLIIPPNALASDASYTFTVTLGAASRSLTVSVNARPAGGSCAFSPSVGVALVTQFTLSCVSWVGPGPITSYNYYLLNADGSSTPLHHGQSNSRAGIMLPQGALTVICEIKNSVGAVTKYTLQGSFAPTADGMDTAAGGLDALALAALAGNADYCVVSFTAGAVFADHRRAQAAAGAAAGPSVAAAAARQLAAGDANSLYDVLMAAVAADMITPASVAGPVAALGSVMTLAGALSPDRIEGGLATLEAWSAIAAAQRLRISSTVAAAFVGVQTAYATHVPAAYSAPGRCSAEAHLAAMRANVARGLLGSVAAGEAPLAYGDANAGVTFVRVAAAALTSTSFPPFSIMTRAAYTGTAPTVGVVTWWGPPNHVNGSHSDLMSPLAQGIQLYDGATFAPASAAPDGVTPLVSTAITFSANGVRPPIPVLFTCSPAAALASGGFVVTGNSGGVLVATSQTLGVVGVVAGVACPGGGVCSSGRGTCNAASGVCTCSAWYSGAGCAALNCPGGLAGCSGHGACDTALGVCTCVAGYSGADCSAASGSGGCTTTAWSAYTFCGSDCAAMAARSAIRTRTAISGTCTPGDLASREACAVCSGSFLRFSVNATLRGVAAAVAMGASLRATAVASAVAALAAAADVDAAAITLENVTSSSSSNGAVVLWYRVDAGPPAIFALYATLAALTGGAMGTALSVAGFTLLTGGAAPPSTVTVAVSIPPSVCVPAQWSSWTLCGAGCPGARALSTRQRAVLVGPDSTVNCSRLATVTCAACADSYLRVALIVSFNGSVTVTSFTDAGVEAALQGALADALSVPVASVVIEEISNSTAPRIAMRALEPGGGGGDPPPLTITFRVEAASDSALGAIQAALLSAVNTGGLRAALAAAGLPVSAPVSLSLLTSSAMPVVVPPQPPFLIFGATPAFVMG